MEEKSSALEKTSDVSRTCLSWILSGIGIAAEIEVLVRDEQVILQVSCGEDGHIAIGRKGQTLEAIQLLVNRIVNKELPSSIGTRILVDIENYRERRERNLQDMASRTAEKVRETGEPAYTIALNSYERYLVHTTLRTEPKVTSQSCGEGAMKQVLISPLGEEDQE